MEHRNNKVRLNVGGQIFVTTYSTLTRTKSMLARMFSGLFPLEKESDGTYFIDRDPAVFSHILNYLRDGSIFVKGMDANLKQALLREAKYYQIYGLVSLLQSDARKAQQSLRSEPSNEKEYKLITNVEEKTLNTLFKQMTMSEGYDFESWIDAGGPNNPTNGPTTGTNNGRLFHLLFSKKLSRGELMLLDRLQNTHM